MVGDRQRGSSLDLILEFLRSVSDPTAQELLRAYADGHGYASLEEAFDACVARRLATEDKSADAP